MGASWQKRKAMASARSKTKTEREERAVIREEQLRGWKMVARFDELLARARTEVVPSARELHGLRRLEAGPYLRLFLLGVFNPVVTSMRGLCAASALGRVQEE